MNNSNDLSSTLPVTQWASEDRPREKMILNGKKSLTNSELLAILLRTGRQGESCLDIAQKMLKENNEKITELARLEVRELMRQYKGIGTAKAVTILAALELGNRMLSEQKESVEEIVKNAQDIFLLMGPKLLDLPTEEFWIICLNQRNKVTWKQCISRGGLSDAPVDIRLIFAAALEHRAVAIAALHNHPSGALKPSAQDKSLTLQIAEAGKLLHIKLLDHLIIGVQPNGRADYFSFAENGLL